MITLVKKTDKLLTIEDIEFMRMVVNEMKKHGQTNLPSFDYLMLYNDLFVVGAYADTEAKKMVGISVCQIQRDLHCCFVMITYVVPKMRGEGVFKSMMDYLKMEMRSDPEIKEITLGVATSNLVMHKVMECMQASPACTTYTIPVE